MWDYCLELTSPYRKFQFSVLIDVTLYCVWVYALCFYIFFQDHITIVESWSHCEFLETPPSSLRTFFFRVSSPTRTSSLLLPIVQRVNWRSLYFVKCRKIISFRLHLTFIELRHCKRRVFAFYISILLLHCPRW